MKVFKLTTAIFCLLTTIPAFSLEEATDEVNTNLHLKIVSLKKAGPPELWDNKLILTYEGPTNPRSVAAAFAFENYRTKYVFKKLDQAAITHSSAGHVSENTGYTSAHYLGRASEEPLNTAVLTKPKKPAPVEKALYFLVLNLPEGPEAPQGNLDYRLIVDGLWQTDPANPTTSRDDNGITVSQVALPHETGFAKAISPIAGYEGEVEFVYRGKPDQRVSVMGSFNNWDPFLHPMDETAPGVYTLKVELLEGPIQYLFVVGTRTVVDPANPKSAWDTNRNQYSLYVNHVRHKDNIPVTTDPPKPKKVKAVVEAAPEGGHGGH